MPYRYYKRKWINKKNKYNIDSTCGALPTSTQQGAALGQDYWLVDNQKVYTWSVIVPSTHVPGTRKVKNIRINMALNEPLKQLWYALVYVPEGTIPSIPMLTAEGYQPSQYVLMQGMITDKQPVINYNRLARNLNCNDCIALVLFTDQKYNSEDIDHDPHPVIADINTVSLYIQYAICYN